LKFVGFLRIGENNQNKKLRGGEQFYFSQGRGGIRGGVFGCECLEKILQLYAFRIF